jgi:hypothetical protein
VAVSAQSPEVAAQKRMERIAGLTLGGIGVVALGVGIYFGVAALNAQDRLSGTAIWSPASQQTWDAGHDDSLAATSLFVVGGTAVAGGALLTILGFRK